MKAAVASASPPRGPRESLQDVADMALSALRGQTLSVTPTEGAT